MIHQYSSRSLKPHICAAAADDYVQVCYQNTHSYPDAHFELGCESHKIAIIEGNYDSI